ncbi:MAG: GNAT family N-acetyltransferase [Dehalococcoidia bacterium]|nr:GNAT family N-acetyltransferase [Dehalococcoidia bacterium]
MEVRIEPVGRGHDRSRFDCGDAELNNYLRRYARQNHESGGARTFVAVVPDDPGRPLGYYTVAPTAVEASRVPVEYIRRRGQYPVPLYLLARLAVDTTVQGQGLGADLLFDAGARAFRAASEMGGTGLLIEAKNERAAAWYRRFGAGPLLDDPLALVLSFDVINDALRASGAL